jgi:hypothetical protein
VVVPTALRLVVAAVVAAAVVVSATACSLTPPRVALYGDSLSVESSDTFADQLDGEARVRNTVQGGAALCDVMQAIEQDVERRKPNVAVLQFSGNNITPCVQLGNGEPMEGADLVAKYASDAEQAVGLLRSRGVVVFLMGSPISKGSNTAAGINTEFQRVAQRWAANGGGVFYVDAGAAVLAPDGSFTETLPCLPDETAAMGCLGGRIVVRAPDGTHFCPNATGGTAPCPVYSSGASRFGAAMAEPVRAELDDSVLPGL